MDFKGLVWKRVRKITFFGLKSGQAWRTGGHTPTKNSQEYPPPPGVIKFGVSNPLSPVRIYDIFIIWTANKLQCEQMWSYASDTCSLGTNLSWILYQNHCVLCLRFFHLILSANGPSTSFESDPLRVTLVGDERGSSKGGLSTLNRGPAKHMARQAAVEVTVLLLHYWVKRRGKKLINLICVLPHHKQCLCLISSWVCTFPLKILVLMLLYIGHGQQLGAPAQIITKGRKCKHYHSEELAMFKGSETAPLKGEEKHQAELKLCKEAEIVATIGPKLAEAISAPLRSYRKDQQVINR